MLPGTQIHSLRIELCLILEGRTGLSFPCASCIAAPSLLSPAGTGPAPAASMSATLAERRWHGVSLASVVVRAARMGGWHVVGFCGRKSNSLWVWVLAFSAIAVSLQLVVSLILFCRSSDCWGEFSKTGACPVWTKSLCWRTLPEGKQ